MPLALRPLGTGRFAEPFTPPVAAATLVAVIAFTPIATRVQPPIPALLTSARPPATLTTKVT